MRLLSCLFALAILTFLSAPRPARSTELDRLMKILAAIKTRQDTYDPVYVQYRLQRTHTKYGLAASAGIEPEDRKLWERLQEATGTSRCEFARKGSLLRQVSRGPAFSAEGKKLAGDVEGISVFDGKLFRTTGGDGKVVTIERKKPRFHDPLSEFNGERQLVHVFTVLSGGNQRPTELTISDRVGAIKAASVFLHMAFGQDSSYTAWLLGEDKAHGVVKLEVRVNGNLFHEYTDCQYTLIDGVYFLKTGTYKNYYHNKDHHQVAQVQKFEVDSISNRADQIPDSLFEIPVSPGKELIDRDMNNLRIRDPAEIEKHIQAAASEAGRSSGDWRKWAYLVASASLLAALAFVIYRIVRAWRRSKLPTPP